MPLRIRSAALVVLFGLASIASAENPAFRGRPLAQVLRELRARGLNLIYSSAVVTRALVVTVEPTSTRPRAILHEILPPLGLTARDGPAGSILIVRSPQKPAEPRPSYPVFVEEIVVTPGKLSIVREDPVSPRTVRHEDALLVPSIGADVSRGIESLPGVTAPDHSAAFSLRGSQPRDVSIVLDGLELYEPFHLTSFQSPFSFIDSGIVDRIDVYGGGLTADFGDRHGGLVTMSTWSPQEPYRTRIEVGSLNSRVAYGTPTAHGSFLISARTWYPEALRDTMELGEDGLDPRFSDAYVRASFHVSPRTSLSVHALAADDRLEFSETDENESVDYRSRSSYVWLRALRSWSPGMYSETVLSAGSLDRTRRGISEPEDEIVAVSDERAVDLLGLRQDWTWEVSGSRLWKAGLDVRRLKAGYRYARSAVSHRLDPAGTSGGLYLAHRARLSPKLAAEVGVRWDRQSHTNDHQWSPRLHAVWSPGERSEVRLGLGGFHQSQRIHELRIEDGETVFSTPELSRQVELMYQQEFPGRLRLRLDAYYRRLSRLQPRYENLFNPIELFPETEADRVLVKPDRARLYGAEVLLSAHPDRRFHGWVSYAWSSALDVIDGQDVPRSWDQTHAVKWLLGYRPGERWTVSLSGSAHTGWPTTPVLAPGVLGPRSSDRFPDYARLDAKVSRVVPLSGSRLRLDLEVVNLTDRENVCCVDEISFVPREDGTVGVVRELDFWLGMTPSLYVTLEF